MEFKGNLGKRITTEEKFVVIKQKSFAWGSYEKRVPYSRIKSVDVVKPSMGTAGYIRIVEVDDDRIFDEKHGGQMAANDENSALFNGNKKNELAMNIKEVIETKKANTNEVQCNEKTEVVGKKKGGKLKWVILLVLVALIAKCTSSKNEKKAAAAKEKNLTTYERFNMSKEEFSEIGVVFEKCGFSNITKVEKEDELNDGTTAYYIEMEGVKPNKVISKGVTEGNIIYVYLTKDKKVSEILVNYNPVYKDGKVLNKICAFTELSIEEKTACQLICETYIKELLKSPSTAKFCGYKDYLWSKENGIIKAQGFVDSENSFGAMIRTKYLLTYDCVAGKPISLNVDGTEYKF